MSSSLFVRPAVCSAVLTALQTSGQSTALQGLVSGQNGTGQNATLSKNVTNIT